MSSSKESSTPTVTAMCCCAWSTTTEALLAATSTTSHSTRPFDDTPPNPWLTPSASRSCGSGGGAASQSKGLRKHAWLILKPWSQRLRAFSVTAGPHPDHPDLPLMVDGTADERMDEVAAASLGTRAGDRVHGERHGEAAVTGRIMSGGDESLEIAGVELARVDDVLGELTHREEAAVGDR